MGLLSSILTLPFAPVRLVFSVAKLLQSQAESELHSPAGVRRQLEELHEAAAAGEISQRERAQGEQVILNRLLTPPPEKPTWPASDRR